MNILADYDHPTTKELAARLTQFETTVRGKLERIFHHVRDDIQFGFPMDGDYVKAWGTGNATRRPRCCPPLARRPGFLRASTSR
ncbi:hypothetical protein [Yoonia sp. SDW83-1]|uniref:hypothetical protein n=1 Tax=Yoonia sp. SDW83-1 TaxID=3366945 RepID=UPI00398C4F05